ncbi:hypothetical protein G6F43_002421 [Rhizopus delemar]|nr:hypothetical protein G6F43_002421 [Rhizopus delemar]
MNPDIWPQLKTEVHNKLVAYEYVDATDNTLSDFVIGLMRVGKSPQDISNELQTLVGSDYDPNVTQWFYERKNKLENPETSKSAELSTESSEPVAQHVASKSSENNTLMTTPEPEKAALSSTERSDARLNDTQPIQSKVRINKEGRIFSRALGVALNTDNGRTNRYSSPVQHRQRSRSRSPEANSSRIINRRNRHTSEDEGKSDKEISILGRSSSASVKEDRPSVFDRLGTNNPVRVPVMEDTKKQRCKYWPNCNNGDSCPYVHPSVICRDFPNCPNKANECMFIHPENATKLNTSAYSQPSVKLPYPCKFFPYCNNPVCPYVHPLPQQTFYMQAQPSYAAGQRVLTPCKNGDNCTRPGCHFLHPKDPNPYADIICKYDGACMRPNCIYKHTKENTLGKVSNTLQNGNIRQFSVPENQVEERIIVGESADIIKPKTQQSENMVSSMGLNSDAITDTNQ